MKLESEVSKVCEFCGEPYFPTGREQKYCSRKCREAANNARQKNKYFVPKIISKYPRLASPFPNE